MSFAVELQRDRLQRHQGAWELRWDLQAILTLAEELDWQDVRKAAEREGERL